jgi:SsrA-binding protein
LWLARSPVIIRSHRDRPSSSLNVAAAVIGFEMSKKDATKGKPSGKPDDSGTKIVARNRRARHDFELLEKVEAGLVLTGTEVKSLRNGKANLEDAYAEVENGEVWLLGCDIPEYLQANRMNHAPKRPRKLLLHRREIAKIATKSGEKGMTLVPLAIYFKKGIAKVELCVARGRKTFDKREAIKARDAKRDMDRALRKR